ncbi:poly-gamma-glutamate synthase PgsB [Myxococcota bacterium]|nr:poly-gamma-glutamate synthase PgsB [Myxococcota bacterium]
MTEVIVLVVITGVLVALGIAESITHERNLRRLKLRIHVNGTRGKSSVTRLVAAGLREHGVRTCAKTTGTLARMIMPDATEYPVHRPSHPNIIEQLRIVRRAVARDAEALVIECMALDPRLQALTELRLIRATHGVITNARADHLDVMGPTEDDVARALAATTPVNATLYTAEERHLATLRGAAEDRGTKLVAITRDDVARVTDADLAGFTYLEHAENVALAIAVLADLGVPRDVALRGMWSAPPDPGVMTDVEVRFFGRRLVFVNGFAANDPESSERIWALALARHPDVEKRIAVYNCRADRPERSAQLGAACPRWAPADHYVLMGTGTHVFAHAAADAGLDARKVVDAEDARVEELFERLVELSGTSALIMGLANIGGHGLELVRHFKNRSLVDGGR